MAWELDDVLREARVKVVKVDQYTTRTRLSHGRLEFLHAQTLRVAELDGDVIEVGVWQGGSAKLLCDAFPSRTVHLFDTFAGMPEPEAIDDHQAGDFSDTSETSVLNYLDPCGNAVVYAGLFPATAEAVRDKQFCFAHIDVDLYSSTKAALAFIWPRLVRGGVIVLDDYKSFRCKGATKAADEFAEKYGLEISGRSPHEPGVICKC